MIHFPALNNAVAWAEAVLRLDTEMPSALYFIVRCESTPTGLQVLLDKGVLESRIVFLSLISAPEGIHRLCKKFPRMKVVTSEIDEGLNSTFQVVPGIAQDVLSIPACILKIQTVSCYAMLCRLRRVRRSLLVGITLMGQQHHMVSWLLHVGSHSRHTKFCRSDNTH